MHEFLNKTSGQTWYQKSQTSYNLEWRKYYITKLRQYKYTTTRMASNNEVAKPVLKHQRRLAPMTSILAHSFRARLAGLRAAPAPLTPPLLISCSVTVHRSRFSLSSFPFSLTVPEPEKLVFFASPAPAPARYSCATVWESEPAGARPNAP